MIGTNNVLEHCFDCLMLGVAESSGLSWATKVVEVDYFQRINMASTKKA